MDRLKDYYQYLSLSTELFCSLDLEGTIREPVGPWLDKTGISIAELIGRNIFKYIHADDISVVRGAMLRAFTPQHIGLRLKNKDGESIWFEVTISSSYEKGWFVLRALDISGRIRKDLENSNQTRSLLQEIDSIKQRLELAIRAVKFGVWDWNLKSGHIIWDSYMYELFDMTDAEFTGEYISFEGRIVECDREALQVQLNETFETRQSDFSSEFRIRDKSGKIKVIKAMGSCFYDSDGKIERMVGNNWDFTSTRETELKLKEAYSEIEKFFSISLDPLCVASTDGYFRRVNRAFVEILGYSEEELTSQPYINFVHPDDRNSCQVEVEKLNRGETTIRFENRYITKSGNYRYFSWVATLDPESKLVYAAVRDLTEHLKAQHRALQSAQMATLGEMASGVAHEINNPLAIVQGKVRQIDRAIQNENIDVDKIRRDIQKIVSTTDRIVKIVKGLRSFSRDSTRDPFDSVWLSSIINEVLDLSSERFKNHGVELRLKLEDDARIQCRGAQIGQVLMNLVNNGHDAVMESVVPENKWVQIESKKIADKIVISVMDSGLGIPDEIANKMMLPFYTTKGVGKGTGLGLSISKGIVEEHLGSLRYEAQSHHTCFIVELPIDYSIKESDRFRVQIPSHF